VPTVDAKAATSALVDAVSKLRYDGLNRPASDGLRLGWPDMGRAWIRSWIDELARDLSIIEGEIATARRAEDVDQARTPLENALWRLDSAREKLHAIIALIFDVPSLYIGKDKKQTLYFTPDDDETRAKLKELNHPAALELLKHDATLKSSLLLRHQIAHSLAPVVSSVSLTWFEVGFIVEGGVRWYEAKHLPAHGLKQMTDIGAEALLKRSLRIAQSGVRALYGAMVSLAELSNAVGELHPPPVIWYATELKRSYADRSEASRLSREAAGLPPAPSPWS
jgi:hypothetical protein